MRADGGWGGMGRGGGGGWVGRGGEGEGVGRGAGMGARMGGDRSSGCAGLFTDCRKI